MMAILIVQLSGLGSEKIIQSSIALLVNTLVYFMVYKLMVGIHSDIMEIDNFSMLSIVLLISLALLPTLFYPIDFLMNGSWGSIDRMINTWPFQLIVNGICLVLNYFLLSKRKR